MRNSGIETQTDASSDPVVATVAPMPLPGAALAAARAAQGLSLEDVARQLKLSVAQIRSIEADDHSRLPSPVFVRGFIRSYARLVKVNVEPLLPPKEAVAEKMDVRMMQDERRVAIEPSPYRRVPAILAGIAFVLLGLAYYEFVLYVPPAPPPVAAVAPQAAPAAVPEPVAVTAVDQPAKPEVPVEPLVLKKSREPVAEATRGLRFVFNGQSWVEVRGADGEVIFSRTNAAGTEKRVQGDPPFSIVVGAASKVQLTYDGRVIDLAEYAANDVARLRLE